MLKTYWASRRRIYYLLKEVQDQNQFPMQDWELCSRNRERSTLKILLQLVDAHHLPAISICPLSAYLCVRSCYTLHIVYIELRLVWEQTARGHHDKPSPGCSPVLLEAPCLPQTSTLSSSDSDSDWIPGCISRATGNFCYLNVPITVEKAICMFWVL